MLAHDASALSGPTALTLALASFEGVDLDHDTTQQIAGVIKAVLDNLIAQGVLISALEACACAGEDHSAAAAHCCGGCDV